MGKSESKADINTYYEKEHPSASHMYAKVTIFRKRIQIK